MLIICFWAVWRLTYMFHEEIGPGHIFERIRDMFIDDDLVQVDRNIPVTVEQEWKHISVPKNVIGEILDCFYCLSVWCAAPLTVLYMIYSGEVWWTFPAIWMGLSGGSIFLELFRRKHLDQHQG